jgi:hypothetical protein
MAAVFIPFAVRARTVKPGEDAPSGPTILSPIAYILAPITSHKFPFPVSIAFSPISHITISAEEIVAAVAVHKAFRPLP